MIDEEKRKKVIAVVDREIEKLRGSFSACSCEMIRQEMLDKMFSDIEKLQPKQQQKKEKLGAIKRILRSVKFKFFK
jgi:hypothetical protein